MFILFTNDIQTLPLFSSIILFADDTTLLSSAQNDKLLRFHLEYNMLILMDWYKANKLSFNVDKTVLLRFWPSTIFRINVGNTVICNTHCTRYLGFLIDDKLTWKEHTNQLYCKLLTNKRLLLNAKNLLPDFCLLKIYFAHIYSHMTYGMSVWSTLSLKSSQTSLYKLQQECMTAMCKPLETIESAFNQLKIIRLPDLIRFHQQKLGYLVSNKLLPTPIVGLFNRRGGKKTHCYETRSKNTPNIQAHQEPIYNHSFLCKAITEYNKLSISIKTSETIRMFTCKLKKHYTSV